MTKNTTKKSAEKTEPKVEKTEAVESVEPERKVKRICYAAETLIAEVNSVFPETPYEVSNVDGRGTALDVTFDLTGLVSEDRELLRSILQLLEMDRRVDIVLSGEELTLVSFVSNARTQDDRAPFDIGRAWIAADPDGEPEDEQIDPDALEDGGFGNIPFGGE